VVRSGLMALSLSQRMRAHLESLYRLLGFEDLEKVLLGMFEMNLELLPQLYQLQIQGKCNEDLYLEHYIAPQCSESVSCPRRASQRLGQRLPQSAPILMWRQRMGLLR